MTLPPNKRDSLILWMCGIPLVVWAAVLAAQTHTPALPDWLSNLTTALQHPLSLHWGSETPRFLFFFLLSYGLGIGIYYSTRRTYRRNEEYGSAQWGDAAATNRKYRDPNPAKNLALTEHVRIGLDGYKHKRNLNVLVIGGAGAGKSRTYAIPNLMQCNTSFVVTDSKGELLRAVGHLLEAQGYRVRVLDLLEMERSHGYNPFAYLRSDADVMRLVTNLIRNTTPKSAGNTDPFWEKSETALLEALILYLYYEAPPEEQNFETVMYMVSCAGASEEDEDYQSPLDILFERLTMQEPEHIAVKQYGLFKLGAGKTAKSILISLGVRLEKFNLPELQALTATDELDLGALGEEKGAIFFVIPDNDSSLNYLVGMCYTQLYQELFRIADKKYKGRLPVHVHCICDEWANVAMPDDYPKLLSVMRSRSVSNSIIVQNLSQIKALFEKEWESIVGNCDELLYLGGNEKETHKYISELIGKQSLDTNTYGQSKGKNGSYSTNFQQTGRELLTPDEVRRIDNDTALLFIRGELPVWDRKYNLMKHPNIKFTEPGGAPGYEHGTARLLRDAESVLLDSSQLGELEVYTGEEIDAFLQKEENSIHEETPDE